MAKAKTVTVETMIDPVSISEAIALDVKAYTEADTSIKQSGAAVAASFDYTEESGFYGIDWTVFKGNQSAATCGMSAKNYNAIKEKRTEYKEVFTGAGYTDAQFDARWQYVKSCSTYHREPDSTDEPVAGKSAEQKACEAARALHRNAVDMADLVLINIAEEACGRLGLEIKEVE